MQWLGLALVAAVLSLQLKKEQPAFSFLVSCMAAALLLGAAGKSLAPILQWLRSVAGGLQDAGLQCLLRVLAIALVTQFGADACRDADMSAAAGTLEVCGRALALLQALPMTESLLGLFSSLLH